LWVLRVGLLASPRVDLASGVAVVGVQFLLAGACVRTLVGASAVAGWERSGAALSPLPLEALA
jgi:hypothetical protein